MAARAPSAPRASMGADDRTSIRYEGGTEGRKKKRIFAAREW